MSNYETGSTLPEQGADALSGDALAALELLRESSAISHDIKAQIEGILTKDHNKTQLPISELADFLHMKNKSIFEVDNLMKRGHELGKSQAISALQLSDEDTALLEWFQQVRA